MDEAIGNNNPWNNRRDRRGGGAANGNRTPTPLPTPTRPIELWFSWSLLSLPEFLNQMTESIPFLSLHASSIS
jgi:hypothetical protein